MRKKNLWPFIVTIICLLAFFCPADALALVETGGIGIKAAQLYDYTKDATDHRGSIVVLDVFRQSVAKRAGLEPGDVILKINDTITKGKDFLDLLENHLRSPSYTEVILIIWRVETKEKMTLKIMREPTVY